MARAGGGGGQGTDRRGGKAGAGGVGGAGGTGGGGGFERGRAQGALEELKEFLRSQQPGPGGGATGAQAGILEAGEGKIT